MDSRKIFLRKKEIGLTLTELIISVAILGVLAIWMILAFKPQAQLAKAKDGKRKADLKRIQTFLEDYYNDHNCYPSTIYPTGTCDEPFLPYLDKVPCDPEGNFYEYDVPGDLICPQFYRIYTKLSNENDPDIEKVGCQTGCGPGGTSTYNYGLASSNVNLEVGTGIEPTTTPAPLPTSPPVTPSPTSIPVGQYYGCISGVCQPLPGPICFPNYQEINCYGACSNPANECK